MRVYEDWVSEGCGRQWWFFDLNRLLEPLQIAWWEQVFSRMLTPTVDFHYILKIYNKLKSINHWPDILLRCHTEQFFVAFPLLFELGNERLDIPKCFLLLLPGRTCQIILTSHNLLLYNCWHGVRLPCWRQLLILATFHKQVLLPSF